jgi:DNA-directed RNA polymerase II subunit RPB1
VLNDWYDDLVVGTFSDDNAKSLVGRLRLRHQQEDDGRQDEQQDMLTELKALEQSMLDKVVIKGIAGIARAAPDPQNSALPYYDDATDAFSAREEVRVETSGSNLIKVLAHDKVLASKTITNDVCEVYEVLGIEAARLSLFSELQSVMCMDNKNNVNYRHLALLVDVMTNRGTLQSIDRHGINRGEIGPLAKCSFEETTDMLVKAGMFAEMDRINGVSANIMLGQVAPCGTGECEILLDSEKLETHAAPVELLHDADGVKKKKQENNNNNINNRNSTTASFVAPSADNNVKERVEDAIELV